MKYTVITPVFNREDCVERCLESVTRNIGERDDVEHIVVDDGSSDETPAIINKYADLHPHVHCIFFPHNQGVNAARNVAIASAKGKFCIILDSDDYWDDNALFFIDETVSCHPEILHFCFSTNDMQIVYSQTPLLVGKSECVLSFEDFLLGRVNGDFVHVMNTDVIKKHPFNEELRIYEGVFFLAFYKEAKSILFVNKVVTHRERSRKDSVTRETIRTNKIIILRKIKAQEILIERYAADFNKYCEGPACLCNHYMELLDNYLLLGYYDMAKKIIDRIEMTGIFSIPYSLKWIFRMRLGKLYFFLLNIYLHIKYDFLHTRLK